MTIHCDQCGLTLSPTAGFCPVCGSEAPRVTLPAQTEKAVESSPLQNPRYCPTCSELNELGHLFCQACGAKLLAQSAGEHSYCPVCGKKNNADAKRCYHCSYSLEDWWHQRGKVAEEFGLQGSFTLRETMTNTFFHYRAMDQLTFGRSEENDVTLPCMFISKCHCAISVNDNLLEDLESANGTYTREEGQVTSIPLALVQEFNLAGIFTFRLFRQGRAMFLYLADILEKKEILRNMVRGTNPDYFDHLQRHFWLLGNHFHLHIRKIDSQPFFKPLANEDYYQLNNENGFFYLQGGTGSSSASKLLLKAHNRFWLPRNWQVILPDEQANE